MRKIVILFLSLFVMSSCSAQNKAGEDTENLDYLYPSPDIIIPHHLEWDRKHYNEKIQEFKANPLHFGDIVLLGNSITEKGGDWSKRFNNPKVRNRGIAGDVTEGVINRLAEIYYYKPEKLFLLIGINDMFRADLSPKNISDNIFEIVNTIHSKSPETQIYVQTILPTINQYLVNKIKETNDIIKSSLPDFCILIDLHSIFADQNDLIIEEYAVDGVHPSEAGYKLWTNYIKGYVNNTNKPARSTKTGKVFDTKNMDSLPLIPKRFLQLENSGSGYCLVRGNPNKKTVALTFDDGPTEISTRILNVLEKENVKATFFWLGQNIIKHPELVSKAKKEGHLIANHSWDHANGTELGNETLWETEVFKTFNALKRFGINSQYYRPPFGGITEDQIAFLKNKNVTTVLWSITTLDWDNTQNSKEEMVARFKNYLQNGSIVLMHDFDFGNAEAKLKALDRIIRYGKDNGFEFVTVNII
ncbi:polysaccharide deacetylase family protein [Gaetbulibacter aestuarii]|uniref:Polysaccharide deacetylase family protein n=1 Tax=Gaetbulibacter aestuarii TaxID=1502358 RepID=A0ABW7MZY3_9FLAO